MAKFTRRAARSQLDQRLPSITGTLTQTLGAVTATSDADVLTKGTLAATPGAATSASDADAVVKGTLTTTLSDWLDSPQERALRDTTRKLALKIDLTPPKAKKKKPGGPPRKLTPDEIADLQDAYRSALKGDAAFKKQEAAFKYLRPLLPRKTSVSDSTLRRRIVLPVLKLSKQPPR